MKSVVYIFSLLLVLLCACGHRYDARLTAIDSMADASPDSAAVLLSEV
ncbi:MAG: hypothetical protein J6I31_04150 [Prevotella sp.]|nr:hypothetical protein [Prevotella sp.]